MKVDLLIASFSAGLLVYSARLLVPTAWLRPEDIVACRSVAGFAGLSEDMLPEGIVLFHEDEARETIRSVMDSRIGLALLVAGTIGGVFATIVGAIHITWESLRSPPPGDYFWVFGAFAVAIGASWWETRRSGWRRKLELRSLAHCFLVWLEDAVGDPSAKGEEFDRVVVSTARISGFSLMSDLVVKVIGVVLTEPENKAAARRIVTLAREHGHRWRRPYFRKWADEVARGTPNTTAMAR